MKASRLWALMSLSEFKASSATCVPYAATNTPCHEISVIS